MTTVLLDSHVLLWWSVDPGRLSLKAAQAVESVDELAVSAITWFELAWLAKRGRLDSERPVGSWLEALAEDVHTLPITPAIAATAAALPDSIPRDPADRLIYATAIEHGWQLVTKDRALRRHRHSRAVTVW